MSPRGLGRAMQVNPLSGAHRLYLAIWMIPVFLTGLAAIPVYEAGRDAVFRRLSPWVGFHVWVETALFAVLGTLLVVLVTASLLGLYYRGFEQRDLLSGMIQAASYQAALLVPIVMVTALCFAIPIGMNPRVGNLPWWKVFGSLKANAPFWFYLWMFSIAGLLSIYLRNVRETCRGVQYASG
jgi:hypothetical protein